MSRQEKNNLDYFPLDCGFFVGDRRIRRLISRFGADGAYFYLYILGAVYGGEGYFLPYTEDFADDAATDIGCSADKIGLMVNYLLDKSLLDSKLFSTVKVLSSHGIQAQYQKACKSRKRDIEVNGAYWLLSPDETEAFIKVRPCENKSGKNEDKSGINPDKSGIYPQSKVKESKGKESKEEQAGKPPSKKAFVPPTREEVREYARSRNSSVDPDHFYDFFTADPNRAWIDSKGNPVANWKQKLITWERMDGDGKGRDPANGRKRDFKIKYDA